MKLGIADEMVHGHSGLINYCGISCEVTQKYRNSAP